MMRVDGKPRQAARLRPATVAVHDDRHVRGRRHPSCVPGAGGAPSLDLHDLGFFAGKGLVDFFDNFRYQEVFDEAQRYAVELIIPFS